MIIKDEIYGTIHFDSLETKIIDSETFQRLRRIKQMSVANLVYPGANHTRFEHSIGTAHLSYIIAKTLQFDEDLCRKVKLYGLLHDVGHTAFSHEGEDIVKKYIGDHEHIGKEKILFGEIADILKENYTPSEIIDIEKNGYGDIVSSDLGSDRMDYLKRDALNTGVAYGLIDVDRIINTLGFNSKLYIDKRGLEAAEYLFVARFMMFSTVYMHHTVRIATSLLYRAMEAAIEDKTIHPLDFIKMDDNEIFTLLFNSESATPWAQRLKNRKFYKEIGRFSRLNYSEEKIRNLESLLSDHFGFQIILDYPHEFFKKASINVKDETLKEIGQISTLIQSLKKAEEDKMNVLVLVPEEKRAMETEILKYLELYE